MSDRRTKRVVLKEVPDGRGGISDIPVGRNGLVVVKGKITVQRVGVDKRGWDESDLINF